MIFNSLWDSAQNGELILVDDGFLRWHMRKDGQITIREIISLRRGVGSKMLADLIDTGRQLGATSIYARCPSDLPANKWYKKRGFSLEGIQQTRSGSTVIGWRLPL